MKVGFFEHQKSGCYLYRIKHPMDLFQGNGIQTSLIHLNEDMDDDIQTYQVYGASPFSMDKVLKWMKDEKRKIIYDSDDALDLIDLTNPFYYQVKKDLSSVTEKLSYADEVTCSTLEMAKYLREKTDKPITVIPNTYNAAEWTFPRPKREGLRIGFAGSPTHVQDLLIVLPAIKNLQKKYDFTFILFGFSKNDSYQEWFKAQRYSATEECLKDLIEFDKILSEIKFEWVPFVDYDLYPAVLTNMALDIGLCPLKDTPFNRCRSACKAMEYTLSGALALASDLPPYQEDKSSIRVKDVDWEDVIETMIKHPDVRDNFRKGFLNWIKENRNISTQLDTLKKVYGISL